MARSAAAIPEILDRVSAIPGVVSAGFVAGDLPLTGYSAPAEVVLPEHERRFDGDDSVQVRHVTPGYAAAVGTPVLRGRYLDAGDTRGSTPVVVLNEEAAARYLWDREPIGATITIERGYAPQATASPRDALAEQRGHGDGLRLGDLREGRFNMLIVGLFGGLALAIASAGLYGVMAYLVGQRTKEIGVRLALGAPPARVMTAVIGRGVVHTAAGVAIGIVAAWQLASLVEAFLFEVRPHDPVVYGAAAALLAACGVIATAVPARRAARVNPVVALRAE